MSTTKTTTFASLGGEEHMLDREGDPPLNLWEPIKSLKKCSSHKEFASLGGEEHLARPNHSTSGF